MDAIAALLVLVAVGLTVLVITAPLRGGRAEQDSLQEAGRVADIDAAKENKYREIRDAEMDFRTGKLSEADWKAIDRQLRADAVALLRQSDDLTGATRS